MHHLCAINEVVLYLLENMPLLKSLFTNRFLNQLQLPVTTTFLASGDDWCVRSFPVNVKYKLEMLLLNQMPKLLLNWRAKKVNLNTALVPNSASHAISLVYELLLHFL